jgi:hypothetical protein
VDHEAGEEEEEEEEVGAGELVRRNSMRLVADSESREEKDVSGDERSESD